jgi:two-component system sensor histidine kinase PilS (NtrC family)
MFVRVVIVSALFALVLALRLRGEVGAAGPLATVYPVFIAFYGLSGLYALVAKRVASLEAFVFLQFAADAACIGLLLLFTGGADSVFTLLFIFPILGASFLRLETGGFVVATFDTVAYVGALAALPIVGGGSEAPLPLTGPEGLQVYSTVAFHIVSFYLVAFLSGSLARKQAETGRALAATTSSLQRLQSMHGRIVQNMDAGLLTVDQRMRVTSINRAAEDMIGVTADAAIGRDLSSLASGFEGLLAGDGLFASSPPKVAVERWVERAGFERRFLRIGSSVLRNNLGGIDGTILLLEDRTRLARLEQRLKREERLAAVGRLSAGIAHEIRNPLASITGSVQVLRAALQLPAEDDELLRIVEREADRLGRLVTDFLSLTREEAPQLKPARLAPLASETLALLKNKGIAAGIEFDTDLGYDPVLRFDEARMRQVLWNLLNNACQAMPGGGSLKVRFERVGGEGLRVAASEESRVGDLARLLAGVAGAPPDETPDEAAVGAGCALRVTVGDNGAGIPAEQLANIFDPFYTTRSGGTGLGLAIVARIIESHHGLVTVRSSTQGAGTRFSLWLPVFEDVPAAEAPRPVTDDVITEGLQALDLAGETLP